MKVDNAIKVVMGEYHEAIRMHPLFYTEHDGYAIILEELEELWDEIKKREPSKIIMAREASHLAAMAIRFLVDLTEKEGQE